MSSTLPPVVRRQTIADALHRTALRLPNKTAIVCGETAWSYADFDALVSRLAAGLAHLGVAEGDKVAVLARNSHGFAALRFALARRGAVLVPINFMLKADEVAYILRHAGAKTLATDSGLAELAQAASKLDTQVQQLIWLPSEDPSPPGAGKHSFDTLVGPHTSPAYKTLLIEVAGVDVLDVADNAARITIAEADALIDAGLDFAENDTGITLELAADGDGAGSEAALASWLRANGTEAWIINPTAFPGTTW